MLRARGLAVVVGLVLAGVVATDIRPACAELSWQERQFNALRRALTPSRTLGNPLRKAAPELLWYTILLREQTRTAITVRYEKVQGADVAAQTILAFMTERSAGLRGFYVQCFLTAMEAEFCLSVHKADAGALGAKFRSVPVSPGETP